MILNLLNTLAISTSLAVSVNNTNFKNEKQPNRQTDNTQTNYTGNLSMQTCTYKSTLWASHNSTGIGDNNYRGYEQTWNCGSLLYNEQNGQNINIESNMYLINSICKVYDTEDSFLNNLWIYPITTRDDMEMKLYDYRWWNRDYIACDRYATYYIALKITSTKANANVKLTLTYNMPNIYVENDENIGYKTMVYQTKKAVTNGTTDPTAVYNDVTDNDYYTKNVNIKLTERDRQSNNQNTINIELDLSITPNNDNWVYIYSQPCKIVDNYTIDSLTNTYLKSNYTTDNVSNVISIYNDPVTTAYTIPTLYNPTFSGVISGTSYQLGTIEVVDVGGVMFDVLGMPFTFISTAFNLTLFPNTAYEINISTLFLSIFAVIVFVFIIKLILGAIGNK